MQVHRPELDIDVDSKQGCARLFDCGWIQPEQRGLHGDGEHAVRRRRQTDRYQRRRGDQQREKRSGQPASKEHVSGKANPVPAGRVRTGRILRENRGRCGADRRRVFAGGTGAFETERAVVRSFSSGIL
jgi:hypothetical protein